ncbi:hypothetical protein [Acetobacterium wieringae]|jgi:hypothetical protein|uniref:Uncharacterized protein n=1 Tax=Acetobacterium wieringae TaxID=52694 RepID=A0A1F2PKU5_9FIRM|nr:hypothetical protein [Acetobacterium wieringae]OFV71494.1 hypothetical protein ACWI_09940 [Acetobacterium wieringae]
MIKIRKIYRFETGEKEAFDFERYLCIEIVSKDPMELNAFIEKNRFLCGYIEIDNDPESKDEGDIWWATIDFKYEHGEMTQLKEDVKEAIKEWNMMKNITSEMEKQQDENQNNDSIQLKQQLNQYQTIYEDDWEPEM